MNGPGEEAPALGDESVLPVLSAGTRRSAKLIALFVNQIPVELGNLRAATASRDQQQLKQIAHKLKGSCRAVGVMRMAAICERLERAPAGSSETTALSALLAAEFETAKTELEAEQAKLAR